MSSPPHKTICRRWRRTLRAILLATLGATAGAGAATPSSPSGDRQTMRLGFTYSMFAGVNENDARASIRALSASLARERGIPADPDPLLLSGTTALAAAVRTGEIDAVGLTTDEYWALAGQVRFDRFLMAVKNGDPTEQYVVLVHRASGCSDLAGLRAKRLAVFLNPRMCLGPVWLDLILAQAGLAPLPEHFGRVTELPKLSKVVLDVFFRQTDACLVTRRAFATMSELNPQVGAQLVVLAASSALVPTLFAFRTDLAPGLKEKSLREMGLMHTFPAGQQALTIFQVGQVAERPVATLESALALLDEYARRRPAASAARLAALQHKHSMNANSLRP